MNRHSIQRRIFIVGVPRSGTTLLQSLLAAHSEITSFTESHFFARHFSLWPGLAAVLTRNPAPRVRQFLAENDAPGEIARGWLGDHDNGPWRLRLRPALPFQTRAVARRLLCVLDDLAASRDASTWVEKTPLHLHFVPLLERVSGPSPRFIHLVRRGQEVVASLYAASQSWQHPYDLETCVTRWNRDVAFSLSRLGAPHDHFILYEELTSDTETSLRRLLAELEVPWEEEILDRYGEAAASVVTSDETWKAGVGRGIRPASTFDQALTPNQRQQVDQSLRADLYDQLAAALARRSPDGGPNR